MFIERVKQTIDHYGMLGEGKILVGVSGGVDSVVLLDVLRRIVPSNRLVVGHLDHGIRGEAARADAEFVEKLGKQLGILVVRGEADVPRLSRAERLSLEDAGRKVRREFLERTAKEHGAARIALGHTRDDLVETVIWHLVRGTGLTGLAGIRPVSLPYVRPLIDVSREEIVAYAESTGLSWREDMTNKDTRFTRNLIRHRVIPLLEEINPRAKEAIARVAGLVREGADAMDFLLTPLLESVLKIEDEEVILDRAQLVALPPGVQALVFRKGIEKVRGGLTGITKAHIDALHRLASSSRMHGELHLPGIHVRVDQGRLVLAKKHAPTRPFTPVKLEFGRNEIPGLGITLALELKGWNNGNPPVDPATEVANAEAVEFPLEVRTRRPGDRFQPLGMSAEKKLKDFLIDAKVPFYARDRLPLVCDRAGIIWVVGVRLAERVKLTPGTKRALIMHVEEL